MSIIDKLNDQWDRLDNQERRDLKNSAILSVVAVPLIILTTGFLLPYTYPALAVVSFPLGALCALAYLGRVFAETVLPVIQNHYKSEPAIVSVNSAVPAHDLMSKAGVVTTQSVDETNHNSPNHNSPNNDIQVEHQYR